MTHKLLKYYESGRTGEGVEEVEVFDSEDEAIDEKHRLEVWAERIGFDDIVEATHEFVSLHRTRQRDGVDLDPDRLQIRVEVVT